MILIICTALNRYAKIKAFQASPFPVDGIFRKGEEFFAEGRDRTGFGWSTLKPSLLRSRAGFMAFSIFAGETAFRKAAAVGGQGLWHAKIDALYRVDAAMRFTGVPIASGRVV